MELPVNYNGIHHTVRKLVREEYVKRQGGNCCHCGEPLNCEPPADIKNKKVNRELFPPNFFKWPVHLHHCHDTGMTIGAVHNQCNAVLWQYYGK